MNSNDNLTTYTPSDVADILHCSRQTVYNYLRTGQLRGVHIGRDWRVTKQAVEDFLQTGTSPDYYDKLKGKTHD